VHGLFTVNPSSSKSGLAGELCCCKGEKPPEGVDMGRITVGISSIHSSAATGRDAGPREGEKVFGSVVASGSAGRDTALNEGVRGVGTVVPVDAADTVCVLHAGVLGCVKTFSLVRTQRAKNE
jgi:hypothetical protein